MLDKIDQIQTLDRAAEVEDVSVSQCCGTEHSSCTVRGKSADNAVALRATGQAQAAGGNGIAPRNVLVEAVDAGELVKLLAPALSFDSQGRGKQGLLNMVQHVLKYSVNTWDQGFLDKLYSSTNAVGVVSELLLSVLNTNLHVYQVSPALTIIERHTTKRLAKLFGFNGPRAGGFSCQGGSAANMTSIVVARNTLYPDSKLDGNGTGRGPFVLFTSDHGHYSVQKAAVACGFGSANVWTVPVDARGRMDASALGCLVARARKEGGRPLYVNATAGTTVLGAYDPLEEIAVVCRQHRLWLHLDGSWGGPAIFSDTYRSKLAGSHLADSVTINPHKMLNVPVTCSFLLGPDTSVFQAANTLPAGYLFHGAGDDDGEVWDLADLTLQCGRRGDSLKLALTWIYYGNSGLGRQVDDAFAMATYLADVLSAKTDFVLLSQKPPACLQVCFYYAPGRQLAGADENTRRTKTMVARLVPRGFMIDYAPGEKGSFFRVVVNVQTLRGTMDGLVTALEEVGRETVA